MAETKAEVDHAITSIPEGDLKKEIAAALENYIDLLHLMEIKEKSNAMFGGYDPLEAQGLSSVLLYKNETNLADTLSQKYGVTGEDKKEYVVVRMNQAKEVIYKTAHAHIESASSLVQK